MSCPDIPYQTALTLKNGTSTPYSWWSFIRSADHKDGTVKAARMAIECLRDGKTALGAALKAIEMIEKGPRFNTWTGSAIRED